MLAIAAIVGLVMTRLGQPLLVAFLIVGAIVGPGAFKLVASDGAIDVLGDLGVALLLFLVGLRLDIRSLKSVGPSAAITGLGQIVVTGAVGYGVSLLLGFSGKAAFYVSAALAFSSTIVIIKVLSDRRELDALHGRLSVGYLIVQDVVAVFALVAFAGMETGSGTAMSIGAAVGKAAIAVVITAFLARYIAPPLSKIITEPKDLGVVFALAWAISLSVLADYVGIGREIGAFMAGVALATMANREAISASLASVRDFLILFFFVLVGTNIEASSIGRQILPALALAAIVSIIKPAVLMSVLGILGYRRRTSFVVAASSGQISEFSVILVAAGVEAGSVDSRTLSTVTLAAMLTFATSIYLMNFAPRIYPHIESALGVFERNTPIREAGAELVASTRAERPAVVVFGMGRLGGAILDRLGSTGMKAIGIDFDPERVRAGRQQGVEAFLGDAEDVDLLKFLPLESTRVVISSVRLVEVNRLLADSLRSAGYGGLLVLAAHTEEESRDLAEVGADVTLLPFEDAADRAVEIVEAEMGAG